MRVCDRCKVPEKRSANTYRDMRGGEIELCKECDAAFIEFLNPPAQENKNPGKSGKK